MSSTALGNIKSIKQRQGRGLNRIALSIEIREV